MPMAVAPPPEFPPDEIAHEEQNERGQQKSHESKKPVCVLSTHQFHAADDPLSRIR